MANATLSIDTLELVSTERVVPKNGSPATQDYNDTQNENLLDHATLAEFINNFLRPILLALPPGAANGLLASTLFTDPTDESALCFDPLSDTPLTVKQSLQYLLNLTTSAQGKLTDVSTQVGILASKLSSTNQNDIALVLQNFQAALAAQANAIAALETSSGTGVSALQQATPLIDPRGQETVRCEWSTAQLNDTYTVTASIEDTAGFLDIASWSYITGGLGVNVVIRNSDPAAGHQGIVHVCAFPLS
jgi:hypothetical protein